jgi:hypothetical protein
LVLKVRRALESNNKNINTADYQVLSNSLDMLIENTTLDMEEILDFLIERQLEN